MNIHSQRIRPIETLSDGDESRVSRALDELSGQELVFKEFKPGSPARKKERETHIRLSRQLSESGFLAAQDVTSDGDGISGYTTPLIEPGGLDRIARDLEDRDLLTVLQTVCQALAHLHSMDHLHCDIKPDNILIERTGGKLRTYVIDLGLALRRGAQLVTMIQGAGEFIAPEQKEGKPLMETSDVFSFGKTMQKLAPGMRSRELMEAIGDISKTCVNADPSERPQSFWDVHDLLRRVFGRAFGFAECDVLPPPLRDTGVRLRVNNLRQHVEGTEGERCGLCLVTGAAGVGKSKIMREFALERQIAGEETIRVTGVQSLGELTDIVTSIITKRRGRRAGSGRLWFAAETSPGCPFSAEDLLRLHSATCGRQSILLLEHRGPAIDPLSGEIRSVTIKPFSVEECVVASSHLQNDPSVARINGQSLMIASAGNPWLLRQCLTTRLTSPRKHQIDEPVDFDRLSAPIAEFWDRQFQPLDDSLQTFLENGSVFHAGFDPSWLADTGVAADDIAPSLDDLVTAGWLRRESTEQARHRYRFVCRTARNFVRRRTASGRLKALAERFIEHPPRRDEGSALSPCSLWELHRIAGQRAAAPQAEALWATRAGLDDGKLAALALLMEYRRSRPAGRNLLPLAAGISDAFDALGSVRRRKRWATAAFSLMQTPMQGGDLTIDDARFLCHLYELSGQHKSKEQDLTAMLDSGRFSDPYVKGYLLSELGNPPLFRSEWKEAGDLYLQAHYLLKEEAPTSTEYVRNLNRVGLSLMRNGHYQGARKRLELCLKLAQELGYHHIRRLALGNLSILEREAGNPRAAMINSRNALLSYRAAGDTAGYLRALPDRVMCLVDLGEGYRAARTAQLAVWLANLHSERVELRHAHNNLGWVLMMQGATGKAHEQLEAAVRVHSGAGDALWAIRSKLNLAWVFLLAGHLQRALEYCHDGLEAMQKLEAERKHKDLHGECEALRIMAQAAIMEEDLPAAEAYLAQIPRDNPLLSPRDRSETALAWLNLYLWKNEISASERLANDLANDAIVENVHPMRCDFGRMRGMLYTLQGYYDRALDILSATASDCRRGGRIDKLIETMIAQVFLAQRMHNWPVGRGYLQTVDKLTATMRQELQS